MEKTFEQIEGTFLQSFSMVVEWFTRTAISISSSSVRDIFCRLLTKYESMVTTVAEVV